MDDTECTTHPLMEGWLVVCQEKAAKEACDKIVDEFRTQFMLMALCESYPFATSLLESVEMAAQLQPEAFDDANPRLHLLEQLKHDIVRDNDNTANGGRGNLGARLHAMISFVLYTLPNYSMEIQSQLRNAAQGIIGILSQQSSKLAGPTIQTEEDKAYNMFYWQYRLLKQMSYEFLTTCCGEVAIKGIKARDKMQLTMKANAVCVEKEAVIFAVQQMNIYAKKTCFQDFLSSQKAEATRLYQAKNIQARGGDVKVDKDTLLDISKFFLCGISMSHSLEEMDSELSIYVSSLLMELSKSAETLMGPKEIRPYTLNVKIQLLAKLLCMIGMREQVQIGATKFSTA